MTTTTGDNGGSATRRRFDGKVVLITGAARGQGREEAVRFAAEGANIIGVDLAAQLDSIPYPMATPEDLATTVAMVEAAGGAILKPIFSFPGGRRFHFRDPSGNELAVWSEG